MNDLERNLLILENIPLADKMAKSKKRKLSHISYAELQSAAYLGLVEAARNYDLSKNDNFPAFAVWRIIGSIRDYLRELSWGSRSNPKKTIPLSSEDFFVSYDIVSDIDFFENLIKSLPNTNKSVLRFYYLADKKISEIANLLDLHQSRISQILTDSKNRLRNIWGDMESDLMSLVA